MYIMPSDDRENPYLKGAMTTGFMMILIGMCKQDTLDRIDTRPESVIPPDITCNDLQSNLDMNTAMMLNCCVSGNAAREYAYSSIRDQLNVDRRLYLENQLQQIQAQQPCDGLISSYDHLAQWRSGFRYTPFVPPKKWRLLPHYRVDKSGWVFEQFEYVCGYTLELFAGYIGEERFYERRE